MLQQVNVFLTLRVDKLTYSSHEKHNIVILLAINNNDNDTECAITITLQLEFEGGGGQYICHSFLACLKGAVGCSSSSVVSKSLTCTGVFPLTGVCINNSSLNRIVSCTGSLSRCPCSSIGSAACLQVLLCSILHYNVYTKSFWLTNHFPGSKSFYIIYQ